ncbi:MAG TPA: polysaccharide biosynthesis/export family protein [Pyrinomonadaceae bacterium]|nr:polysaccharide biosynthesis/export family protein [Pyrinomonadaceae bacterium]
MKAVRVFLIILTTVLFSFDVSYGQTDPLKTDPKTQTIAIPNSKADNEEERYRIGFQDKLEIQVFRHPELSQKTSVNPDGTITLFRAAKPIVAVCKTETEVAKEIEQEYLTFLKKPEVNVFAVEKLSQSFGVIGAVEKAGTYYINRRIRLLELISFAGGPNKEAGSRMIVARTGSSSACKVESDDSVIENDLVLMNFKVKDVLEGKQNLWMQPGDIVSVLDSDVIYIYGNVNKVGSVKMGEPITLTQAIVSAEGLKPTAKTQVRVLRQKPGSTDRDELIFNLKDIEKRKIQDPFLEPNDIVAVSEDSTKAILKGITGILKNGVPSLFYRIP